MVKRTTLTITYNASQTIKEADTAMMSASFLLVIFRERIYPP